MKNACLLFGLFIISLLPAMAQKRVIMADDFLRLIQTTKGDTFRLSNVKIVRGENIDRHFVPYSISKIWGSKWLINSDTLQINKLLDLKNVEFDWDFTFQLFRFHKEVWMENCSNLGLTFFQCRFDSSVFISSSSSESKIFFRKSVLHSNLDANSIRRFYATGSQFYDRNYLSGDINQVELKKCQFEIRNPQRTDFPLPTSLSMRGITNKKVEMEIIASHFISHGNELGLDLFGVDFRYFNLQSCHFEVPVFLYLTYHERMIIEKCRFDTPLDFREINLPASASNIAFEQISGKIGILDTFISIYHINETLYQANTNQELANALNFNELIAVYSKFLNAYKYRGDQKSYNACYIEMKNISSRRAAYEYHQKPSLEGFFEWRLNQFLQIFCDYGTNPVKSLIFSFYVILAFSLLYFLFPSEEDNLSKNRLTRFLSRALDYFTTNKNLSDFQSKKRLELLENIYQLRQKIKETKENSPAIVYWIGFPFYAWIRVYYGFLHSFYSRSNIVPGQWASISTIRKSILSVGIGLFFIGFLLSGLFVRILNALALSLNVFVTLGYGEISASGSMRYFAVLEGLMGWFFLSIFSVSLIGQVLQ